MEKTVLSVSQLNNALKNYIEANALFRDVCVRGEISNYKLYPSGHHYFSLKDAESTVSCVLFRGSAYSLRFRPENGMQVLAAGRISVYPRDGKYQLYVSAMMPAGAGDLQLAFEQLKARLEAEGLFDEDHKKELPAYPGRIALITSPVGAAVQDMIRILGSRWPLSEVLVVPVRVQGTEAAGEIATAIGLVNRNRLADLIITGRGGGSLEDLWAFNEEIVARAVYASEIPVIAAVGHEPDITIADYVADLRASTPSNAAELAVPDKAAFAARLANSRSRLINAVTKKIALNRKTIKDLAGKRVLQRPDEIFALRRMDLDMLRERMLSAEERMISGKKQQFLTCVAAMEAMSPLKVLTRGYTITETQDKRMLRSAEEASREDRLTVRFYDGSVSCLVDKRTV